MKINWTKNGRGRGLGTLGSLLDFFFPRKYRKDGTTIIRHEASAAPQKDGSTKRAFSTFRALAAHFYYYEIPRLIQYFTPSFCWPQIFIDLNFARRGAIGKDASDSTGNNSAAATLSDTHTSTGSNLMAICHCAAGDGDGVSGVTWAGVAMTQVAKIKAGGYANFSYTYAKSAPATGAQTVTVSVSPNQALSMITETYTGVNQSDTVDASITKNQATGTSITENVTTVANNCWLVSVLWTLGTGETAGTNTTVRTEESVVDQLVSGDSNAPMTPAGSYAQAYSWTGSDNNSMIITSLAPAPSFIPKVIIF